MMWQRIRFSVGMNKWSFVALFIGAIVFVSAFDGGMAWAVRLIVGVFVCGLAIRKLLSVPWDLVNLYDIQDAMNRLFEASRQMEEADRVLIELSASRDGDVKRIIIHDWDMMPERERQRMSYLVDGINDRNEWIHLYRAKRRKAAKCAVFATSEIAAFYQRTRRMLGRAYQEPDDWYPAGEQGTKPTMYQQTKEPCEYPDITDGYNDGYNDGDTTDYRVSGLTQNPAEVNRRSRGMIRTRQAHQMIAAKAAEFNVMLEPDGTPEVGPSITRYPFHVSSGQKLQKVTNISSDLAFALGVKSVRIAQIVGRASVIGIEVPNKKTTEVKFKDLTGSDSFQKSNCALPCAIGFDITGKPIIGDLAAFPHVLIAGTTGSGKSVFMNVLICGLLSKFTPDEVKFIMVDPKMVELSPYNGIPHLQRNVITDTSEASAALEWAADEMERRYKQLANAGVQNIAQYKGMPYLVIVVDEMADLMMTAAKEVEESIIRIAQKGRAAGVHLILATQRPSADVITGLIKSNVPSRIAFAVASGTDSRIILDEIGAEELIGKGDMIYAPNGGDKQRIQGAYIKPNEIKEVIRQCKQKNTALTADD